MNYRTNTSKVFFWPTILESIALQIYELTTHMPLLFLILKGTSYVCFKAVTCLDASGILIGFLLRSFAVNSYRQLQSIYRIIPGS